MIALRDGRLVLPDRLVDHGTLVLDASRIADVTATAVQAPVTHDLRGAIVVPGFVDVHVHGVEGLDTLDEEAPLAAIARRLPRSGVTAFCPTTVACSPAQLGRVLAAVAQLRQQAPVGARVLPAHLESNFINPEYRGAQPLACLRLPPEDLSASSSSRALTATSPSDAADYSGSDIIATLDARAGATGIVTMAPELPGGLELVAALVERGIRVSLGHSGARYDEACAGIAAGARHATHLFNRMSPLHHRDPGLVGAVLEHDEVDAELICDGYHVHPSAAQLALRLKSVDRIMAITDGTGGSGLPVGSTARLGRRRITVKDTAAFLDDGTLAGSTLTMDRAFRNLVQRFGCSLVEAARLCATNPARALKLADQGRLAPGGLADFVVLDEDLIVRETWVGGVRVWSR